MFFGIFGAFAFVVIIGVILIFNTGVMRKKEGRSLTAQLSLIVGGNFIFLTSLIISLIFLHINNEILRSTIYAIVIIDIILTGDYICFLFYSYIYQKKRIHYDVDYIIVLGSGINSEKLTPLLKSRVDKGLSYYKKQSRSTKIITSGGKGPGEPISESLAMANYIIEQIGIPSDVVIMEDKSTNTFENMKFSLEKIKEDWNNETDPKVIFSTSNYHVLRSSIYARKVGLKADGVGAPTSFFFLPSATIREFIALMLMYKWYLLSIFVIGFIMGFKFS